MSLREMPDHFLCDVCQEVQHLESLCVDASSAAVLRCVWCCRCAAHQADLDMPGTVIWPL